MKIKKIVVSLSGLLLAMSCTVNAAEIDFNLVTVDDHLGEVPNQNVSQYVDVSKYISISTDGPKSPINIQKNYYGGSSMKGQFQQGKADYIRATIEMRVSYVDDANVIKIDEDIVHAHYIKFSGYSAKQDTSFACYVYPDDILYPIALSVAENFRVGTYIDVHKYSNRCTKVKFITENHFIMD